MVHGVVLTLGLLICGITAHAWWNIEGTVNTERVLNVLFPGLILIAIAACTWPRKER